MADMGLARRLEPGAAATLTGETGTYFYMAPEMFRHEVCPHGSLTSAAFAQRAGALVLNERNNSLNLTNITLETLLLDNS